MIKLRVDDETAIPLSVDSSSAVSMTVSEAFIDRGGAAIQNNKNAAPSTSQVVVTPDPGYDAMAKVTVAAMPQGEIDPATLSYDEYLLRGRITAEANITQAGYVPLGGNMAREYCDELLPTENPKTVTPTTSEQTAVAANKWTKGAIKVGPIPSEYIVPTGTKSISANGTGIDVKAYEKVDVAVPGIVPSGTLAIATNGSHDVTNYATASVAVPASAVDSGTKSITANGNGQDVVGYAAVNVNVPNSYAAADEGKVVSNGALVSQTSDTVTANGTYDTTLINSLTVNVSGGGGDSIADGIIRHLLDIDQDEMIGVQLLEKSFFERLTGIGRHGLAEVTGCKIMVLPAVTTWDRYPVSDNPDIEAIDFGTSTPNFNYGYTFSNNAKMNIIIIRKTSSVVSMPNINCVQNTPFASGGTGGTLYVPSSLVSSYQSATNWSTVLGYANNSIASIEGSYYETHYADGTVIT